MLVAVSAAGMVVPTVIVNLCEETAVRVCMVLDAPHVTTRLVNVILPLDFFPCNSRRNLL